MERFCRDVHEVKETICVCIYIKEGGESGRVL